MDEVIEIWVVNPMKIEIINTIEKEDKKEEKNIINKIRNKIPNT